MNKTLVIDAKAIKEKEIVRMKKEVDLIKNNIGGKPCLVIISASDDRASENYIKSKIKMGKEVGIEVIVEKFDKDVTQEELENFVFDLNNLDNVDGIILQMPIYPHLDSKSIINNISPQNDADCFTSERLGEMIQGEGTILPCTPSGIIKLLEEHNVEIEGKNVTIIGRSVHVGLSLSILLTNLGSTVSTCHSRTDDLEKYIHNSDIVISCVGKEKLIKPYMMKKDSVLIGVGISIDENGRQQTDYDIQEMKEKSMCRLVGDRLNTTGTMTVLALLNNVIELCKENNFIE